ncbi:hypothetical protein ZHAS_00019347 [Anopheles sinensis]|uniref:Endosome-associated-trafficking regulator 1 n=1 Tax=Anopheles sinensis TaxID=74873 RepID=A0A084WM52_ANOSI|nr:hypothetical protein ZHAS_00019347 [Anopheles sinensis]
MAKDNNNINTDDLTDGGPSSSTSGTVASSTTGTKAAVATTASSEPGDNVSAPVEQSVPAPVDPPTRREENPFSFKHFLKWDGPAAGGTHYNHTINGVSSTGIGLGASGGTSTSSSSSINHSRSTSNINGHGSSSTLEAANSNGTNGSSVDARTNAGIASGNPVNPATTITTSTGSPSKSATTSSLNVVSSTTGARPKIPQFQSVNTLSSESKMKRSPRFPSFDSQSSLSDFADERFGSIYQSRSNSSFSSDYPPGAGGSGAGLGSGLRGTHSSNGGEDAELLRGYVPRSYSNYDLDSPGSAAGTERRHEQENDGGNGGRLVGATEFSAALPDFVQDHLVMEQWYNTLPKGGSGAGGAGIPSGGGGGSGSSGSVDFDDMFELAGVGSSGVIINDMPFDLTASSTGSGHVRGRGSDMGHRNSPTIPLDLPPMGGVGPEIGLDLPHRRVTPTPSSAELPPDLTEGNPDGGLGGARSRPYYYSVSPPPPEASSGPSAGTADKIHRLPDFLSDGPIHSSGRLADVTQDTPHGSETAAASAAASNHRHRLQQRQREAQYQNRLDSELAENERLRRELDQSRQTVSVQARRIRELERDLESMVSSRVTAAAAAAAAACGSSSGNGGSTQSNANSFMQAKTRAASAEAEVKKLRQKIHSMSVEMDTLRRENETLKEEVCGGAIGGSSAGAGASAGVSRGDDGTNVNQRPRRERSSAFLRAHTIALRQAASSAENNLRQLLSGVENLRTMANQIETFGATQTEELGAATAIPLEDYLHDLRKSKRLTR